MARPSKLTEKQWNQIRERLLAGEPGRRLADEFGVSEAAIRKRLGAQCAQIKVVANQVVAAEAAVRALPVSAQIAALNLADELRSISTHLASAAKFGAATSHRLLGIANAKVQEVDDATPLDEASLESLKGVAVLTKIANDSSTIGLNLLAANKDMVKQANTEQPVQPVRVFVRVEDASRPEPKPQQAAS